MKILVLLQIVCFMLTHMSLGKEGTSMKKDASEDAELLPDNAEKMVFISGIIRLYENSLKTQPKNVPLRERYVAFLEKYGQNKKAVNQLKVVAKLKPDDPLLAKKIEVLEARIKQSLPGSK